MSRNSKFLSNQKEAKTGDRFSWRALEKAYAQKKKERLMDWGVEQLQCYKFFNDYPAHKALPAPVLLYFLYLLVVKSLGRHLNAQDLMSYAQPSEDSVPLTLLRLMSVVKTLYCQEVARR